MIRRAHLLPGGFSLIELMIALTVSVIILAALSATFVGNSRARTELDKAAQQIENGRYAMMTMGDDLQLAGFLAEFNIVQAGLTPPAAKPDPCITTVAGVTSAMPLHVQGYDSDVDVTCLDKDGNDLLANRLAGTDILVVRRVSTCTYGSANCTDMDGAPYFQASLCANELNVTGNAYRLDTNQANLTLTQRNCTTQAQWRRFLVHVYYVDANDEGTDDMPTLKRAELVWNSTDSVVAFESYAIANGIENLQFEYGIDTNLDGTPDAYADPDTYDATGGATGPFADCAANTYNAASMTGCTYNWFNVTAVRVSLLSRNPLPSQDYTDTKTYTIGPDSIPAFNDKYKRHVYQAAVRVNNAAVRRE